MLQPSQLYLPVLFIFEILFIMYTMSVEASEPDAPVSIFILLHIHPRIPAEDKETFPVTLQFKMETYPSAIIKSEFSIEIHLLARVDPNRCPHQIRMDLPRSLAERCALRHRSPSRVSLSARQTGFILRDVFWNRFADTKIIRILRHRV